MTLKMVKRFIDDKSTTSVAYKRHAATLEDQYPTFSICLKGNDLYKFDSSIIFKAYGIYPNEYQMLLEGKPAFRYRYNAKSKLYKKTPLPQAYQTNFTFEDMAQNLFGISHTANQNNSESKGTYRSVLQRREGNSSYQSILGKTRSVSYTHLRAHET